MQLGRVSFERRKNTVRQYSEMPYWAQAAMLDEEMKRRLEMKDKPKEKQK
jgi:hypothetical protein